MDGITLAAIRAQLSPLLVGGKIEKIQQPEKDELIVTIRSQGTSHRLLMCASASHARVHLTQIRKTNPIDAPAFCMLLRRRLTGGRIAEITQPGFDRVLRISIEASDELGEPAIFTLIAEIMGKHANIILTDANGRIVESIKHVTPAISRVRCVLPGLTYADPPPQNKLDPSASAPDAFFSLAERPGRISRHLFETYAGLSPASADALVYALWGDDAHGDALSPAQRQALAHKLWAFYQDLMAGRAQQCVLFDEFRKPVSLQLPPPLGADPAYCRPYPSISEALEAFYSERDKHERLTQRHSALNKTLNSHMERVQKKLQLQQDILLGGERREQDRRFGELVTANMHQIKRGQSSAIVEDYYTDPPQRVAIPLDVRFSPSENAQRYYKRYQKARIAAEMAQESVVELESELLYLEGQLDNLSKCTEEAEVQELREELIRLGYVRASHTRGAKAPRRAPSTPMHFRSSDGIDIFVGKNNAQNDQLTLHMADGEDTWLHTQRIPGSHVIIKARDVPESTLRQAAQLAAYFSRSRSGAQVPVDYTLRKHIKKPSGARPGFVIYSTHRTLYVTPDEAVVKQMEVR